MQESQSIQCVYSLGYSLKKLRKSSNVFALVMESAWQSLMKNKISGQDLFQLKIALIRKLIVAGHAKERRKVILPLWSFISGSPPYLHLPPTVFGPALHLWPLPKGCVGAVCHQRIVRGRFRGPELSPNKRKSSPPSLQMS